MPIDWLLCMHRIYRYVVKCTVFGSIHFIQQNAVRFSMSVNYTECASLIRSDRLPLLFTAVLSSSVAVSI